MAAGELAGKRAIVSGVGPGLGREIALSFAAAGAQVVLGARSVDVLEAVAKEIVDAGGTAVTAPADITVAADCEALVATAVERLGGVDILVNNAFAFGSRQRIAELDMDEWRLPLEVNLIGTVRLSKLAAAVMVASGGGSIVMVNSQAMRRNAPRRGPYSASKAALLSASQTLASELGPKGVRVNTVVPGQIWGDALEGFYREVAQRRGVTPEEVYADVAKDMALRRIATAPEVAEAVLFFASDRSSAITGQSLDVNAGNWFH